MEGLHPRRSEGRPSWTRSNGPCRAQELGAGEILLTSMDADGTKDGYDIELTDAVADAVNIPVIASGGCGNLEHIYEVLTKTKAEAALAASIFHYGAAHRAGRQGLPAREGGAGQMTQI